MRTFSSAYMSQPAAPEDRATDFKAVEGDTGEHFSGYTLMVEAYAAIWLILMGWLVLLWRKQSDLTARVEGLEGAIARAERKGLEKNRSAADTGKARERAKQKEPDTERSA
jgi:hypothetical protein